MEDNSIRSTLIGTVRNIIHYMAAKYVLDIVLNTTDCTK